MTVDLESRYLRWDARDGVAFLTIDRPERRNAMTASMYVGVRRAVYALNGSARIHALVITGAGDVFCPGGELGGEHDDGPSGMDAVAAFGNEILPYEAIRRSRKPVVAMVNGTCQGGGLLISLVCDVAVASDRAIFRAPEVIRGVADSYFAAYLPAHVGVAHARDLLLTGRRVGAHEAFAMGMISRVVPHDALETAALEVVGELVRGAPEARWQMKRIVNERYGDVDRMTIDASVAGPEVVEGFTAFVEHRMPAWVPDGFQREDRL